MVVGEQLRLVLVSLSPSSFGKMEWSRNVDCMGEWTSWMRGKVGRRIEEMDDEDGSVENIG